MASDVTLELELLDREGRESLKLEKETTLDDLLVRAAEQAGIRPVARSLFAFRQGGTWLSPGQSVASLQPGHHHQPPVLQLRLRYKMPDWKAVEKPSSLRSQVDPKAFQYYYSQVRRDFENGHVFSKKNAGEKELKWWSAIFKPGVKDSREDRLATLNTQMLELVARLMAIDVIDGVIDKKELVRLVKDYIPKGLYTTLEKPLLVNDCKRNIERYVDKICKSYPPQSIGLKDNFLKTTEKSFPSYFCESFPAQQEVGGTVLEVRLVVLPPTEDKPVSLSLVRSGDMESPAEVSTIDQLCNIAVKDSRNIEISRKNGVPLYFCLASQADQSSLLALLCGYYRLAEKWTFSLCTELRFPVLERLLANKVHGPVKEKWAEEKLAQRTQRAAGCFLVRQCPDHPDRLYLHLTRRAGCKPDQLVVHSCRTTGQVWLESSPPHQLPVSLQDRFPSVDRLVFALRTMEPGHPLQLGNCVHPSEFDRAPSLLLCRTHSQRREDSLGSRLNSARDKVVILLSDLNKYEESLAQGRCCRVWRGVWRRHGRTEKKEVAIKQLNKSLLDSHQAKFLDLSQNAMLWDDGSLTSVFGFCLPVKEEPPVLVTEYFTLGPLSAYLVSHRLQLQPVDLLEAATCLARALHYLQDNGIVHGEIRARNIFVCVHSDSQFKVKLAEGSLDAPRKEEVHWLDFQQLQAALMPCDIITGKPVPVVASPAGDVWSAGTTIWEMFSLGREPGQMVGQGQDWQETARKYLAGYRLPWPGPGNMKYTLGTILEECWQPLPGLRKQPQALMRDCNQLLYKVFNSRRVHDYVTIDVVGSGCSSPTLTPGSSARSSFSVEAGSPVQQRSSLVPVFTDISRQLLQHTNNSGSEFGSSSPLLPAGVSSRSGSLFNSDMSCLSGLTCQTSLDWGSTAGMYSMSSIYQLDDSQIEYTTDFPLGVGNFGVVFKGVRTKSDGDWEQVAIKQIKDSDTMSNSAQEDMEREVKLMKQLSHENIVKIRGVLPPDDHRHHTIIVMEFIREGSLDRFLQVNRHNLDYPRQLFGYCQNIVDGMDYLTQNKIIHRDLAARNILVADQETVKISDFGLARVATNDFYVMHSATNIPVRWEAIECLTHRKYSHKSDVWSFGVTLWEMFSFGATPTLAGCQDFFTCYKRQPEDFQAWLSKLEEGVRLPRPDLCPALLYQVMLTCWHRTPQDRPTFQQLKRSLKQAELEVT